MPRRDPPAFAKRHYEFFARTLQTLPVNEQGMISQEAVVQHFAIALNHSNPNYDINRFREASTKKEA